MSATLPAVRVEGLSKDFVMHLQNGLRIPVITGAGFEVNPGECVVLGGPSGAGKSSILKMVYGNYRIDHGHVWIATPSGPVDVARAAPREVLKLRQTVIGYVSQFLRAIPRVSARDIVMEPALAMGLSESEARTEAERLLAHLNVPERLWTLPPATFSGGEQQRVNIARGFAAERPVMLLDEPTASLDAENRAAVIGLIAEARARGAAMLAIFHDREVREALADRIVDVLAFAPNTDAAA
jgi:alpha-D-ribose 1-methylphosphonate 5-triphosphate synthase subunit PhnL